jgi:hypothetical protein
MCLDNRCVGVTRDSRDFPARCTTVSSGNAKPYCGSYPCSERTNRRGAVMRIGEPGGHDTAGSSGFSRADHEIPTTIRLGASNASYGVPSRVTRVLGVAGQVVASSGHLDGNQDGSAQLDDR